jgi:hypothetical protein
MDSRRISRVKIKHPAAEMTPGDFTPDARLGAHIHNAMLLPQMTQTEPNHVPQSVPEAPRSSIVVIGIMILRYETSQLLTSYGPIRKLDILHIMYP